MAKVAGIILTLTGGLATLFAIFVLLNTSVVLPYNVADAPTRMSDVGWVLPSLMAFLAFCTGVILLTIAKEPNPEMKE